MTSRGSRHFRSDQTKVTRTRRIGIFDLTTCQQGIVATHKRSPFSAFRKHGRAKIRIGGCTAPCASTRRRNEREPSSLAAFAMRLQRDFDVLIKAVSIRINFSTETSRKSPLSSFDKSGCFISISLAAAVCVSSRSAIRRLSCTTRAALSWCSSALGTRRVEFLFSVALPNDVG